MSAAALSGDQVAAAALVCAPGMTPTRLRTLLADRSPPAALAALRRGDRSIDPTRVRDLLVERRTRVLLAGEPGFPIEPGIADRPSVLLVEGDRPDALSKPRVAIVGTRAASVHGRADARELGRYLGEVGVTVVSGLAIGIDGCAHEGAIEADGPVVGVVATGLDVVYPRRHRRLHDRVRAHGVLISETGFGVGPHPGRFPVRNRIIAALADVVVVVEATITGGARITADRALDYGRPVLAVPGSRRNPAAAGTNALIADGAHPLLDHADVLLALGLTPGVRRAGTRVEPDPDGHRMLAALAGEPATPDELGARTGLAPDVVAVTVAGLERAGWTARDRGLIWPL